MKDYQRMFRTLFEEQLVAAEEDYAESFETEFGSKLDDPNWANREWAVATLRHLLSELYEDRTDFYDLCDQCGLDQTTLTELGF